MGTTSQWLRVVGFGAFFTAFMLLISVSSIPKWFPLARFPKVSKLLNICVLVLGSISIGMVHEFDWKELRSGKIGIVFALATLITVSTGLAA